MSLSMATMSELSLQTAARPITSTASGAVQRPRKPGLRLSYTCLHRPGGARGGRRGITPL